MMRTILMVAVSAAALGAQRADTTATKAALLARDRALSAEAVDRGAGALLEALALDGTMNIPGEPIHRGVVDARASFLARYGDARTHVEWTPQHAIVSLDGRLGCTIGVIRMRAESDTTRAPRGGRYITCWTRAADGRWQVAAHARNGENPATPPPAASLGAAPHSATTSRGAGALRAIQDADAAFAKLAVDSGPGIAFARFAAGDAMLLGGRPVPPRGPAEIRAVFEAGPLSAYSWAPVRALGVAGGGLGFTIGESVVIQNGQASRGKYLTVWRQEADGRWRYVFDLGSARP
jgi:ketosteroid isomerase-like protein